MQPHLQLSATELFSHVVGDAARSVSERKGETRERESLRSQAAVQVIMGFQPRDMTEAMLAGQCLMFHELMLDTLRDLFRGGIDTERRAIRDSIVAMDRAFGNNLARLERSQRRVPEDKSDVTRHEVPVEASDPMPVEAVPPETVARAMETAAPPANRAARRHAARAARLAPVPARTKLVPPTGRPLASRGEAPAGWKPSARAIANCRINPTAMAALEAGDARAFALAMGVAAPKAGYLAAAAERGGVFTSEMRPSLTARDEARAVDGDATIAEDTRLVAESV